MCRTLIIVLLLLACLVYIILLSEIGAIARENLHGSIFDIQETTIRVNSSASYKIPKVCYQTWVTKDLNKLSNSTRSTILSNQKLNPDIKFVLWDDGDVDRFMRTEYSGRVYQAFSTLNPKYGAARADFFRYCVLLKHGGLYLDIKSIFKVGNIFGKLILPDDICILDLRKELEPHRVQWKYGTYEQWFLVFAPGHPYLQRMVDRLVRNIEAKFEAWPVGTDALMPKESSHSKKKILRLTGAVFHLGFEL